MGWGESGRKKVEERWGERDRGQMPQPSTLPPWPLHSYSVSSWSFQPWSDTSSRSMYTGYEWRQQNGFEAMLDNCVTFTTSFPVMMTQILNSQGKPTYSPWKLAFRRNDHNSVRHTPEQKTTLRDWTNMLVGEEVLCSCTMNGHMRQLHYCWKYM